MQQAVTRYQQPAGESPDLFRLGKVLATSGYFKDAKDEAQAVVKVLAGQEIGIGPVAAMVGIHVVDGKPTFSARLMASLIKRSGRYTYRVKTMTDQECTIEFFEDKELAGVSTFTMKDATTAQLAGKQVWKAYPRNMLFARAMSNGFNWYTPDLSNGLPVYTPEEMGAEVNEDGEIIQPKAKIVEIDKHAIEGDAYTGPDIERDAIERQAELVSPDDLPFDTEPPTDVPADVATLRKLLAAGEAVQMDTAAITEFVKAQHGVDSPRKLTQQQAEAIIARWEASAE